VEVKDVGDAFDGTGTFVGNLLDTGAPMPGVGSAVEMLVQAQGLPQDRQVKWRGRLVSRHPFQKRSPWFSTAGNALGEADVRSTGQPVAVRPPDDAGQGGSLVRSLSVHPMPFVDGTTISFELARAARVRVAVYDVRGRRFETLLDGDQPAGVHLVRWGGGEVARGRLASGVYLAVVEASGERLARKLVIAR
jgi:hypothetical protein